MHNFARLGTLGIVAIVALRLAIGWHFFMEGADKVKSGKFSSEGFLKSADGRLAGYFHGLIWDRDGSARLDYELVSKLFKGAAAEVQQRFSLSGEQVKAVERQEKLSQDKLKLVFEEYAAEISKHQKNRERLKVMSEKAVWNQVPGLRAQKERIAREDKSSVQPAIESIQAIWDQYERNLNAVATSEQRAAGRYYRIERPGEGVVSSRTLDKVIPVFDLTIGALLVLGLLVPWAATAGALFLFGVVLSQFPGDHGTELTYFHAVEALALIFLASVGAGRFAGLDFLTWAWWQNRRLARSRTTPV
ncbi:MAG: hypothetical protein KF752_09220 [Pirellulaceae bacterium]|nr:hypothetical protein [Pirellulaceae bacterium]